MQTLNPDILYIKTKERMDMMRLRKYILNPTSISVVGFLLGIMCKLLDIYSTGMLVEVGYMFSNMPVWILIGVLISRYSETPKTAMVNILPFSIFMLVSYYGTAELLGAPYSPQLMICWILFACATPIFAGLAWKTRYKSISAKMIAAMILLVTIWFVVVYADNILDYLCIPILFCVFFVKRKHGT